MHRLRAILILMFASALSAPRLIAQTPERHNMIANRSIPDGNSSGISEVTNLNSTISSIGSLKVRLRIAGEFNGDLYGYIRHGNQFAVILNRPGKTLVNAHGYAEQGMDVLCQTGATNGDIHVYDSVILSSPGSELTGIWEPDGRRMDPARVMDTTHRSTSFTDFSGISAAGEWTLYLADLESGGTNFLSDWSLEIAGAAYPSLAWFNPADVVYGTPLDASQLNATANFNSTSVPGTFVYTPAPGTVLNAGTGQSLSVLFTPSDPASYLPASTNVFVNVTKAPLAITANNINKLYGAALPPLTASYSGFVNGDTPANLTTPMSLATTATALSDLGTYVITANSATSSNYFVTFNNGLLTIYTTNLPPVWTGVTNIVLQPDGRLALRIPVTDPNGDELTFNLDAGPGDAFLTNSIWVDPITSSTNAIVRWVPTRARSSTTNLFTIRVTDNGAPSMSSTQSFLVTVLDYLELSIGSTNLQAGQTVALPIQVASDKGITNLTFRIPWAPDYFTNALLSVTAPGVQIANLQDESTNLIITLSGTPVGGLQGTQQVAELSFLALSNQHSAFVSLPIQDIGAEKPDGSLYENYLLHDGRLAVVQNEALLSAGVSPGLTRGMTVFGKLGVTYELQSTTNLFAPNEWRPSFLYLQTNNVMHLDLDSTESMIFYRLLQR